MTLLTCMQTSSTMSTCIININNDNDNDPASPPLPPHLSSDNNNNNGHYPDHHDHPYQQHRQQQKGSRHDTSRALRYVFLFIFLLLNTLLTKYLHYRLLTTTQWQPYPTQSSCEGPIGWRKGRGKGWGLRRDSSRALGMFFLSFF